MMLAGQAVATDAIINGKVKSVDTEKKSFVLTDSNGKDYTLKLDDNVVINRNGKESKNDLKASDPVSVFYDDGVTSNTAKRILVQEGDFKNCWLYRVSVKSFDSAAKKVTFHNALDKNDYVFTMGDAKVQLNGQNADMQNIKIGEAALIVVDSPGPNAKLRAVMAWGK
jgi:Cu/Ag efflux protein CusF